MLEDFIDVQTERVGDAEREFQGRRVFPRFDRVDGLARRPGFFRELLLRHFIREELSFRIWLVISNFFAISDTVPVEVKRGESFDQ